MTHRFAMPKLRAAFRYIPAGLLFVGCACFVGFAVIGGSVAPDGRLQEPFALLPLGWLCVALGAIGVMPSLIRRLLRRTP